MLIIRGKRAAPAYPEASGRALVTHTRARPPRGRGLSLGEAQGLGARAGRSRSALASRRWAVLHPIGVGVAAQWALQAVNVYVNEGRGVSAYA